MAKGLELMCNIIYKKEHSIKYFLPLFDDFFFTVTFEHLISGIVLYVSRVAVEVSIAGVYLFIDCRITDCRIEH